MRNLLFRVAERCDRISHRADYADGAVLAAQLMRKFPRAPPLGKIDWRHLLHDHVPDDAALVQLLAQIAPRTPAARRFWCATRRPSYRFESLSLYHSSAKKRGITTCTGGAAPR